MTSISVIVVSDFEPGAKSWNHELTMAATLARQDVEQDFEVVFVEDARHRGTPPPPELTSAFPGACVKFRPATRSSELKDHGISECESDWVAVLEADALPDESWLRELLVAADENLGYDLFSGRTFYGDSSAWQRALNLLDRGFDDMGRSGPTHHISNNGALCRTSVIKGYRYPEAATPFLASRLRNERILADGHKAWFVRSATMRHQIGGFGFVMDFRRHTGFADMATHRRPAFSSIPGQLIRRMRSELKTIARLHNDYWRWYDWPLGLFMYCFARYPETLGMISAARGRKEFVNSSYR